MYFLTNHLSPRINLLSSTPNDPLPSINGTNGNRSSGGPSKDYFSADPRHSPVSFVGHPAPSITAIDRVAEHTALTTALERRNRSNLRLEGPDVVVKNWLRLPKIPSQLTRITHMPEPSIPAEAPYTSYADPGGSNGAGPSIYTEMIVQVLTCCRLCPTQLASESPYGFSIL